MLAVAGSSHHKAASVPLEAEPPLLGLGMGSPLQLAQGWLRRSWSWWGQGRTEGRVRARTVTFTQSFSDEASASTCGTIHTLAPWLTSYVTLCRLLDLSRPPFYSSVKWSS